jgi:polyisoprenoid-binding protein YceI
MVSNKANGQATMEVTGDRVSGISNLTISVPTKSLSSGTSSMDDNAYNALQADKYPTIRFVMKDVNITQTNTGSYLNATGELTIAGTTRQVQVGANGKLENGKVYFEGKKDLKLSAFNIEPPTAMFGTIKTGDAITVHYKICF